MKYFRNLYRFFLYVFFSLCCVLVITVVNPVHFNLVPDGFGKTHFISGVKEYPTSVKQKNIFTQKSSIQEVLFCPSEAVREKLCTLIKNEKRRICIAIYSITDTSITRALVEAHNRGVSVEVITDRSSPIDRYSKIGFLYNNNIPVFLYQPPLQNDSQKGLMHHKFALFFENEAGRQYIWHGSFNFTASGYKYNCESVVLIEDTSLFTSFETEFERIKKLSLRYTATKT